MASLNLLADHDSELIGGGARLSGLSTGFGSLFRGATGGDSTSNINQTGLSNNANIGSTGLALFSIGAIYL
jgi:hypothetical protein